MKKKLAMVLLCAAFMLIPDNKEKAEIYTLLKKYFVKLLKINSNGKSNYTREKAN
jgi:hypothetical protein